jgi:site-specific recombinase XerD
VFTRAKRRPLEQLEHRARFDRLGRPYTPMMDPDARRGQRPPNYGRRFPSEVYSPDEMRRLLACCGRGLVGHRNRAMIVVMWRGGLRIAEATALDPRDFDADAGTATVRHGKGNKRRVVPLDPQAVAVVERWLVVRAMLEVPRACRLFTTISKGNIGAPVQHPQFREALHRIAQRAVVDKRVHPHGFRHTCAVDLLRDGWDVKAIQMFLGHNDLATTDRYLSHLMPWQLIQRGRARTWPTGGDMPELPEELRDAA